jgi:hypothetical protein
LTSLGNVVADLAFDPVHLKNSSTAFAMIAINGVDAE